MFNECHIHLCDCTCLNVFSHAQSWLNKHKKILSVLVVFGKYFVFFFFLGAKMSKFSKKTVLSCFGDSVTGWSSHMLQSRGHTKIFCYSLAGQCPNHKKYLKYFSKFGFLMFIMAQSGNLFVGGGSSHKGTQRFSRLTSWLSCG